MQVHKNYCEKTLLVQVAGGNEQAFRELFDHYHTSLFNYVAGMIKSSQVAEELVMDVFMKIWLGREVILQIGNFNAFLFRIAHNKSVDFLRSVAKDPKFQELLWDRINLSASQQADTFLMEQEIEAKLRSAIILLSPQRKKVYEMSRQEEMTHDQIAAHLKISKNTVNNHIVEAQHFIRSYLSKSLGISYVITLVILWNIST